MGGKTTTTFVAIHDDLGVVYIERSGTNNTTRWCSFSDRFGCYANSYETRYPYTSGFWFTFPVSRQVFEDRMRKAYAVKILQKARLEAARQE